MVFAGLAYWSVVWQIIAHCVLVALYKSSTCYKFCCCCFFYIHILTSTIVLLISMFAGWLTGP